MTQDTTTQSNAENKKAAPEPKAAPVAIGITNKIVIEPPGIRFFYQIDPTSDAAKNDELTLIHNDSDWTKTVKVSEAHIEDDWVEIFFMRPPEFGSFSLLQDPKDDEEPFYVFWDEPYESLRELTPDAEDLEFEPEPEADSSTEVESSSSIEATPRNNAQQTQASTSGVNP